MKKRIMAVTISIIMTAGMLAGCGASSAGSAGGSTIKIGAVVPLTGDVPSLGESAKNGYQILSMRTVVLMVSRLRSYLKMMKISRVRHLQSHKS